MPRPLAAILALATALLLTAVPIATVSACSCAMTEFDDAVRDADFAFVGRPISIEPTAGGRFGNAVLTTWSVDRSRDPISATTVTVRSWPDDGANCGVTFAREVRWLVLAYSGDGALETNGCMQNRMLDGSDPDGEADIASMLPAEVGGPEPTVDRGVAVPVPVIGMAVALALVVGFSVVAFRRQRP
jgi:hypothetical protein